MTKKFVASKKEYRYGAQIWCGAKQCCWVERSGTTTRHKRQRTIMMKRNKQVRCVTYLDNTALLLLLTAFCYTCCCWWWCCCCFQTNLNNTKTFSYLSGSKLLLVIIIIIMMMVMNGKKKMRERKKEIKNMHTNVFKTTIPAIHLWQ